MSNVTGAANFHCQFNSIVELSESRDHFIKALKLREWTRGTGIHFKTVFYRIRVDFYKKLKELIISVNVLENIYGMVV